MRRSIISSAGLLVLTLALAACGSGSAPDDATTETTDTAAATAAPAATDAPVATSTTTDTGTIDVTSGRGLCAALTPEEAAAALGAPVDGGSPDYSITFGNAHCIFAALEGDDYVKIDYRTSTREEWDTAIDKVGMTDEEAVEVGEAAWQSTDSVFKGGTRLAAFGDGMAIWVVIATDSGSAEVIPAARDMGRKLLETMAGS